MLLLGCDTISAPELSRIFSVSTRTIHRDIDAIREAGIPLDAAPGVNGGIGIPEDFKIKNDISSSADISEISAAILALLREFPALVDDDSYIAAKHRYEAFEQEKSGVRNNRSVIRVALRFHASCKGYLSSMYEIGIVSLEDNYYKAHVYVEAVEREYNKLLLLGDKCECTDPRHVREYIKNKLADISKIYAGQV